MFDWSVEKILECVGKTVGTSLYILHCDPEGILVLCHCDLGGNYYPLVTTLEGNYHPSSLHSVCVLRASSMHTVNATNSDSRLEGIFILL